mmetsp:Transcript_28359/g.65735  ORF Transcript_28359/g.65735 Transcript_28359/m.65735 type:complete len:635 (+) Transcript_28359:235-2139(+)
MCYAVLRKSGDREDSRSCLNSDTRPALVSFKTTYREALQARRRSQERAAPPPSASSSPLLSEGPGRLPHEEPGRHDVRFNVVIAFAARRICSHFDEDAVEEGTASVKGLFDESCFGWLRIGRSVQQRTPASVSLWLAEWASWCLPAMAPDVIEVCRFLSEFLCWSNLPPDLVVMAVVYMDELLKVSTASGGSGHLTSRSWRPVLATCLLIASKMWEDWCVYNFELADHLGVNYHSLLGWEVAAMNLLGWSASVDPEASAPYFWMVERAVDELKATGSLRARDLLRRFAHCERDLHQPWVGHTLMPLDQQHSLESVRRRVGSLPAHLRGTFAFVKRLEDRYEFFQSLGQGTYGEVKLALQVGGDKHDLRAVKVWEHSPASWSTTAKNVMQRFVLSGMAGSMRHPNIVRFIEFVIDEGQFPSTPERGIVPVMEALTGPDLCDWLAARQQGVVKGLCTWIQQWEAVHIAHQVGSGLAYIHQMYPGLVHRDVKPENLRWATDATSAPYALPQADLRLVDFGTVYVTNSLDAFEGQPLGTPLYSAPEVFTAAQTGARPHASQDIFALGVILFFLITGQLPWPERDGPIPLDVVDLFAVPAEFQELVLNVLQSDPSQRVSATRLLEELSAICPHTTVVVD